MIEIIGDSRELTLRQRWAHAFTIMLAIAMLLLGINLRNQALSAVSIFESVQDGIRAEYPQNWLLDTDGDYVFRVRDMSPPGFKTTFQVSIVPVGRDATERNVADRLTATRIQVLTAYQVLADEAYVLPDEQPARSILYTYVSSDVSPFLQGIPNVVIGFDVLVIRSGQAIIITYQADRQVFEEQLPRFEQFLAELVF